MTDYLHIGSSPPSENCVQIGTGYDNTQAQRLECRAYIQALERFLGTSPPGARLRIKAEQHDFGTYHEVVCDYDSQLALEYALACESQGPETWADAGMKVTLEKDSQLVTRVLVELEPREPFEWKPQEQTQ